MPERKQTGNLMYSLRAWPAAQVEINSLDDCEKHKFLNNFVIRPKNSTVQIHNKVFCHRIARLCSTYHLLQGQDDSTCCCFTTRCISFFSCKSHRGLLCMNSLHKFILLRCLSFVPTTFCTLALESLPLVDSTRLIGWPEWVVTLKGFSLFPFSF